MECNSQPFYWAALSEYINVLSVYEKEMEHSRNRGSLFSRMFRHSTYPELVHKIEGVVTDTNPDISFILSPSYYM